MISIGDEYEALTIIGVVYRSRSMLWLCRCRCGVEIEVRGGELEGGTKVACSPKCRIGRMDLAVHPSRARR